MHVAKWEDRRQDFLQDEQLAHSNLQFFKSQQWSVTNYGFLLYGALIGLTQLGDAYGVPGSALLWFPIVIGLAATIVLWSLEAALHRARQRAGKARAARGLREDSGGGWVVVSYLTLALALGSGLSAWVLGAGTSAICQGFATLIGVPLGWICSKKSTSQANGENQNVDAGMKSLHKNIGRALIQAQFSRLGRDLAHQQKSSGTSHLVSPHTEQLPAKLVASFSDLTDGMLGFFINPPKRRGTVLHLRELPKDWEDRVNRTTLEAFVIHLVSACEWFIDDVKKDEPYTSFMSNYPTWASVLGELRATRNCIVHNAGVVDERYLSSTQGDARALKGILLPLDWKYAYERTLSVLEFAEEVGS
jgi:hypothetical protein